MSKIFPGRNWSEISIAGQLSNGHLKLEFHLHDRVYIDNIYTSRDFLPKVAIGISLSLLVRVQRLDSTVVKVS